MNYLPLGQEVFAARPRGPQQIQNHVQKALIKAHPLVRRSKLCFYFLAVVFEKWTKMTYGWTAHQMYIGTMLTFLLLRSGFKPETNFGFSKTSFSRFFVGFFIYIVI